MQNVSVMIKLKFPFYTHQSNLHKKFYNIYIVFAITQKEIFIVLDCHNS